MVTNQSRTPREYAPDTLDFDVDQSQYGQGDVLPTLLTDDAQISRQMFTNSMASAVA